MKIPYIPPLPKGMKGDFLNRYFYFMIHKISPNPSFPKRGIFGSMTLNVVLPMDFLVYAKDDLITDIISDAALIPHKIHHTFLFQKTPLLLQIAAAQAIQWTPKNLFYRLQDYGKGLEFSG